MNLVMKIIVLLVIVGLMGFGFYVFDYQAKLGAIAAEQQKLADKQKELEGLKKMAQNLASWEQAKKDFSKLLAEIMRGVPLREFIPSFLEDIEDLSQEERTKMGDDSFRVTTIQPGPSTKPTPEKAEAKPGEKAAEQKPAEQPTISSERVVIQLSMKGRFNTLVDFLQQLGQFRLKKLVTVQRLSLAPEKPEVGHSPVLTITMPFEAYMFGEGGG